MLKFTFHITSLLLFLPSLESHFSLSLNSDEYVSDVCGFLNGYLNGMCELKTMITSLILSTSPKKAGHIWI